VALVGLLLVAWMLGRPDGRMHVAFLDVGQGDAIFVQTPAGRQLLVDGGRYSSALLDELGRQMPFWDHSIDIILATHPDDDHIAGLVDVLERYDVSQLLTNGSLAESDPTYEALLATADARGVPLHVAQTGESIILDEGIRLDILHAGSAETSENRNDGSVVARLTFGDLALLLAGDAEASTETALLRSGLPLDATILKAGHHGANTSSSEPFLRAVSPQVVVISAGLDNAYGHPHPAMLARALNAGATILRTDESGTLELITDGQKMWWELSRAGSEYPVP
jgi:competence protein ComEC